MAVPATAEGFVVVEDAARVAEPTLELPEAGEEEEAVATFASASAALPLTDDEASLPTPALVLSSVTSSADVAFHIESAEPMASTAAVSAKEPKSPEPDKELTWQSRPRAAEHEAAFPAEGTL